MSLRRWLVRLKRSNWLHPQSILVILVVLFMLGLILFSGGPEPVTGTAIQPNDNRLLGAQRATEPLAVLAVTITPTPELPAMSDTQQTDGVILSAALVILVIIGGTLFTISRKR